VYEFCTSMNFSLSELRRSRYGLSRELAAFLWRKMTPRDRPAEIRAARRRRQRRTMGGPRAFHALE